MGFVKFGAPRGHDEADQKKKREAMMRCFI